MPYIIRGGAIIRNVEDYLNASNVWQRQRGLCKRNR